MPACAAICALTLPVGIAQAAGKTIIVFDASDSMWGQIDGKPTIDIAKNTLKQVLGNWNTHKPLGLKVCGHRSNSWTCASDSSSTAPKATQSPRANRAENRQHRHRHRHRQR